MRFFWKKRGVNELLGSGFSLPELETSEESKPRGAEYQRLKKSVDSLKDKYSSLSRVEERLERFATKHADAVEASLKNEGAVDELSAGMLRLSEHLNSTTASMNQSLDKLKEIVLGLNDELCSLRKDFYSMTNKDAFNQFKAEVGAEVERFKGESAGIDHRLGEFRKLASEQAASRREMEADFSRLKNLELDLKKVIKVIDGLGSSVNDLKIGHTEIEGKLRNGLSAIKEELTLDEDVLNKLILKNKEFIKIKDELIDFERRFKLYDKELKNLGDDDLSMRDFMQKDFRMLRVELGMVRAKVLDALKKDEQMQARIERVLPPKLDREIEQFNRKFADMNLMMQTYVRGEEFKSGMDIMNMKLGQLTAQINSLAALSTQLDAVKRHVDSGFERYDILNKHIIDKIVEGPVAGARADFSRIADELKQLEDAKAKLDTLSGSITKAEDPAQRHIFSWIEGQLNSGKTPRQVKQTLTSRGMDAGLVDKYFASQ